MRIDCRGFNVSQIKYRDRLYTASRTGWAGSNIILNGKVLYRLRQPAASFGREDPRLFIFRDRLHVAYTGVVWRRGRGIHTNVCYARLNEAGDEVEKTFAPVYADRAEWEKNWSFFDCGGELYCVYSISPHRVLKIDGNEVTDVIETENLHDWSGGYMRGGASPVLHDGQYHHFFHGAIDLGQNWPTRQYNVGLCVFESKPPFRATHVSPDPLYVADHSTRPADQYCSVIFPSGAYRDGDVWRVSCGVHDRWGEVLTFR